MKNKSFVFLLLLSLAGFFDSAYLTILHYKNVIPPCAIAKGCETVLTSRFSVFFGIPIALIGSLFFLALIFLLLLENKQNGFSNYFIFNSSLYPACLLPILHPLRTNYPGNIYSKF